MTLFEGDMKSQIVRWFEESAETKLKFIAEYAERVQQAADLLVETFRRGNKLLFFGNGGSAMDASHLAAEFVGRYRRERTPLAAIALSADQAKLTCIANDYDFSEVFARQIRALGREGDVAIGISTSGNSPNVLKGLQAAREQGLKTIGWTGGTGGKLVGLVDHSFIVPSTVVARIQESHITLGHVLCELVDEALLGKE
jgi:D-sedoheptulose 7-phosphate isomerase